MNKKAFQNKRNIIIVVIGLLVITLMTLALVQGKITAKRSKDLYEVYVVRTQEPVITDGISRPNQEKSYYYDPTNGVISAIHVKNGQNVKISDPLFAYHNETLVYQIEDAKTQQKAVQSKERAAKAS